MNRQDHRVSRESLVVKLKGPGADSGEVDARALARTLASTADLCSAIAKTGEFREHESPEVLVEATREGSFEVQFVLEALGDWWASARGVLVGDDAQAVATLAGFCGLTPGVIGFLKRRGRRKVAKTEPLPDGRIVAQLEDGEEIIADAEVAAAAGDPRVVAAARDLASSAGLRGVSKLEINASTVNIYVTVNASEAAAMPEPDEPTPEMEQRTEEVWATFDRPHFGGDKWGVTTARGKHRMTIADKEFLARVDAGQVSISKYTEFRITYIEEPYLTQSGQRRYRRTVTRVSEDAQNPNRTLPIDGGGSEP